MYSNVEYWRDVVGDSTFADILQELHVKEEQRKVEEARQRETEEERKYIDSCWGTVNSCEYFEILNVNKNLVKRIHEMEKYLFDSNITNEITRIDESENLYSNSFNSKIPTPTEWINELLKINSNLWKKVIPNLEFSLSSFKTNEDSEKTIVNDETFLSTGSDNSLIVVKNQNLQIEKRIKKLEELYELKRKYDDEQEWAKIREICQKRTEEGRRREEIKKEERIRCLREQEEEERRRKRDKLVDTLHFPEYTTEEEVLEEETYSYYQKKRRKKY